MKLYFYATLLLVLSLAGSCKNKNNPGKNVSACGVKDPVSNLAWLKKMIDEAKSAGKGSVVTIKKFEYKGNTYFNYYEIHMSCLNCVIFDCSGERVLPGELFTEEEYREFAKESYGPSAILLWPGSLPRE